MRQSLPPLNWIRAFEASARHLSFTEAAREMNVTQAAVSQKVKALETHLGRPLFHRLTRSLKLTNTGEAYLPSIREGFLKLAEGTREVFGGTPAEALTIRVGATLATTWLGENLPHFQAAHPDIPVRLVTALWPADRDWEGIDVDIRFGVGPWPGTHSEKLTSERFFPICARTLLDGRDPPASMTDLKDHTVYQVAGNTTVWTQWLGGGDNAPKLSDLSNLQVDTWVLAANLVACGGGIAMCYTTLWSWLSERFDVVKPFNHSIDTDYGNYLVTPGNLNPRPEAEVFTDWMRERTREQF